MDGAPPFWPAAKKSSRVALDNLNSLYLFTTKKLKFSLIFSSTLAYKIAVFTANHNKSVYIRLDRAAEE